MMKIFVLCLVASVVTARPSFVSAPSYLPAAPYEHVAYEPTIVAHAVEHLPTAVSHQSQTIIHEKRPYLRPIVEYAPAAAYVKHHAPVYTKYVAAPAATYTAPLAYSAAPLAYTSAGLYGPSGWNTGFEYATSRGWNGWPLK